MLRGVDHLVIAVRDLDAAIRDYRALGFTVVPGGRHKVGTHNALIAFEDGAYLELIAFHEPAPGHRWWEPLARGGGLVDYCLQTDDLEADVSAFERAGVAMTAPPPSVRVRPDGYEVKWTLAVAAQGSERGVAPFLIRDQTPRAERVPRETRHANEVVGLRALTVAVDEPAVPRAWYEALLGRPASTIADEGLAAEGARVTIGPHAIDFLAPRAGAGPLAAWLAARGPSPYAARFRTASGARGALEPSLTHGARLALE